MNVRIITYTAQPERTVAHAAWVCTHGEGPTDSDLHPDRAAPLIRRVLASGHSSVLEHVSFTFAIDGISRACSHQLVRHRAGCSYSQQSQRYVPLSDGQKNYYVTPGSLADNPLLKQALQEDYAAAMEYLTGVYQRLIDAGIPAEDARLVLPNAASTRLVVTMNARALHHFFSLRCCTRAQWEIRDLANEMLRQCRRVAPVLFETAGPGCARGACPEGPKSCGGML